MSTSFFRTFVSEEALSKCPQTRLYLVMTQYTMEKTRAQASGVFVAQFLDTSQIMGLSKTNIRDLKGKYLPLLVLNLGEHVSRLELGGGCKP